MLKKTVKSIVINSKHLYSLGQRTRVNVLGYSHLDLFITQLTVSLDGKNTYSLDYKYTGPKLLFLSEEFDALNDIPEACIITCAT